MRLEFSAEELNCLLFSVNTELSRVGVCMRDADNLKRYKLEAYGNKLIDLKDRLAHARLN